MKKSISYWSFDGGGDNSAPLSRCFREARAAGFDAVEPAMAKTGEITPETSKADCERIAADARAAGVEIASLATGMFWRESLTSDDPAVREKALDNGRRLIEKAAWLGADAVLVVPGAVDVSFLPNSEKIPYDVCYKRSVSQLKKLARTAEKFKVKVGVENVWNKFLLSPIEMRAFIDEVGSPCVGAYFDIGNILLIGFPQDWINILGKRIVRVHAKDFKTSVGTGEGFAELLKGDVPWKETVEALKKARYNSYVTAEIMPFTPGLLKRTSKALDKILSYSKK